jgi:hypothetical protein
MKSLSKRKNKWLTKRRISLLGIGLVAIIIAAFIFAHKPKEPTFAVKPVTSSKSLKAAENRLDNDAKADNKATQQDTEKLESLIQ